MTTNNNKPITYETTWRNKWITSDATSVKEMKVALFAAIEALESMEKDGLEFDFEGAADDYIFIRTENSTLAAKHHMDEMFGWDDEEDCDDELDATEGDDTVASNADGNFEADDPA